MKPSSSSSIFQALLVGALVALPACDGCSAGASSSGGGGGAGAGQNVGGEGNVGGGFATCDLCEFEQYIPCDDSGNPLPGEKCSEACVAGLGCVACVPGDTACVGNDIHACAEDGTIGDKVDSCDPNLGFTCAGGECKTGCDIAENEPTNVGCVFWAVDLDQQDGFNDPASAPWGVAISNTAAFASNVTIEINNAPPGSPPELVAVETFTVDAGSIYAITLPTRELDCGSAPNQYDAPGTCLSSNAFRITASNPVVVYQFNVFENTYSNDASLLLPQNALGKVHRVIGWPAGHPVPTNFPGIGTIIDRSYVTIVGTQPDTTVRVNPTWKIRGNPPIAATEAGGELEVVLQPFDVLNLETDDAAFQDDPETMTDLSGTAVVADKPVAVFSGVESTGAPGAFTIPTPPGWKPGDTCCLDHLEDQMFPVEALGSRYVVPHSPVRSQGAFVEADVIRFVGAAETAQVTTTLPAPFNAFSLAPGQVVTTYAQADFTASADKPFLLGQILVSNEYIDGSAIGDPALTVFPPIDQFRTEYIIPTPPSWDENWVVITEEVGSSVTLDGNPTTGCAVQAAGNLDGKAYESRRCPLQTGAHSLSSETPFGIVAYGYGSAGSYALVGGARVEVIYEPPPIE